jgi:hypothetical protein
VADRTWTWRHAIIKSDLPATARHVLLTISCFMNEIGGGCYPTQKQLSDATGLSDRAIRTQLDLAETLGWITRSEHGFKGQKWRNHQYQAAWPEGAEGRSAGQPEGAEAGSYKVRKDVPTTSPVTTPSEAAREKFDLESLTDRLVEAAGDKIQPHGAIVLAPILGLIDAGCDLETDILPTIRARSAKLSRPAGSWSYFVAAIREAYEQRIEAGRGLSKPKSSAPVQWEQHLPPEEQRVKWGKTLGMARQSEIWRSWLWGPPPGKPGCRVPADLLNDRDLRMDWMEEKQAA